MYLPESFEWMILNAGVVQEKEIMEILKEPEKYIESQKYFSWERFFTNLLIEKTDGTYMKDQKSKLNPVYLHEKNKRMILSSARGILWFCYNVMKSYNWVEFLNMIDNSYPLVRARIYVSVYDW